MPNYKVKAQIILDLQNAFNKDKGMKTGELIRKSGHVRSTIEKYFGSVSTAFQAASIEIGKHISNEEALEEFKRVCGVVKRLPTMKDLNDYSDYSARFYIRRFGEIEKIAKMLSIAFGGKTRISKEELLKELKRVCELIGRAPKTDEMEVFSNFSHMVYRRNFGSFNSALEEIGQIGNPNGGPGKTAFKCFICGIETANMTAHWKDKHPEKLIKHDLFVLKLFKGGLSTRKIAARDDVICRGATSVLRIIKRFLSKEEIEEYRRKKISVTLEKDYADGKYDWVNEINTNRNITEEAREKNSRGLKKAYEDGKRDSWNAGLTKEIDNRIALGAERQSENMKEKFASGEIETRIGPESSNWNEDRDSVRNRYRLGLGFSAKERESIKKRAGYKCQICGRTLEELKDQKKTLECDHIIPIYAGGTRDWENNGQALCSGCHKEKTLVDLKKYGEKIKKTDHLKK